MNFCRLIGWFSVLGWSTLAAPAPELLARVHWLGLTRISADTNAAHVTNIWHLPQTTALVAQTLDKISRLPGHGATNAGSALLRPLLDDLLTNEFYLELSASTNPPSSILNSQSSTSPAAAAPQSAIGNRQSAMSPTPISPAVGHPPSSILHPQLLLALRLPPSRARLWQTNLPAALPKAEIYPRGDWTLVGLGDGAAALLPAFTARVLSSSAPAAVYRFQLTAIPDASSRSNVWFEADLDPARLADIFSLSAAGPKSAIGNWQSAMMPSSLSHIYFTAVGEAGNVHTRATLDFSRPLDLKLSPWEIPTNFIHQPLTCFTAVRGLASWLAALPAWQNTGLTPAPDQLFAWAQVQIGGPFVSYVALPLPSATNQLARLADRLLAHGDAWLATNAQGTVEWLPALASLIWHDALLISPVLRPVTFNHHDYLLGGLIPFMEGNPNPTPVDIFRAVLDTPNVVYYSAEQTGPRVEDDFFITQLFRVVFHRSQLPPKAAGTLWLKNLELLLGPSTTVVTQKSPDQLAFGRVSTLGFTAFELHLLADWLESPQFPCGLHTFRAPPDK